MVTPTSILLCFNQKSDSSVMVQIKNDIFFVFPAALLFFSFLLLFLSSLLPLFFVVWCFKRNRIGWIEKKKRQQRRQKEKRKRCRKGENERKGCEDKEVREGENTFRCDSQTDLREKLTGHGILFRTTKRQKIFCDKVSFFAFLSLCTVVFFSFLFLLVFILNDLTVLPGEAKQGEELRNGK